ncbi:TPA: hypothetical protein VA408_001143 [Streptococcus agalactiae]|nr:hypothetical protein [Streptococcus agalactiae]
MSKSKTLLSFIRTLKSTDFYHQMDWTGPIAIPIVPETLTFEEFKAYEDVKKASETNQISLGISLKEVDNCSIPLSKFKQLLFTSDNPDNLSNLMRFLVKSVSLIKDSKFIF